MTTILCATRGGASSFPNQDRAIALAQERHAQLIFLHVANVTFLNQFASPKIVDMEAELEEMGEFMLIMAEERAEKAGITAQGVARQGGFQQALQEVIGEYGVTAVTLGAPVHGTALTTTAYLQTLTQTLLQEQAVEVFLLHDGDIIEHHLPTPK
ncbi:MAG: universal stress protein [Ardenticatenaceae bacterium]|nr:universal stress protein [Ardenticatenaceae bacterium]